MRARFDLRSCSLVLLGRGPPFRGRVLPFRGRGPPFRGRVLPFRGRGPPFRGRVLPFGGRGPPFRLCGLAVPYRVLALRSTSVV